MPRRNRPAGRRPERHVVLELPEPSLEDVARQLVKAGVCSPAILEGAARRAVSPE